MHRGTYSYPNWLFGCSAWEQRLRALNRCGMLVFKKNIIWNVLKVMISTCEQSKFFLPLSHLLLSTKLYRIEQGVLVYPILNSHCNTSSSHSMFPFAFWVFSTQKCEAVNFPKFESGCIHARPLRYLGMQLIIIACAPCLCVSCRILGLTTFISSSSICQQVGF